MSTDRKDTYWTLWRVLNWIICREPEDLWPWGFTALKQPAGAAQRKLSEEPMLAVANRKTGKTEKYYEAQHDPLDDLVDDAESDLIGTLQNGTVEALGLKPEADVHERIDKLAWITLRFTDKQGAQSRSLKFENVQFPIADIKKEWPETSDGLLALRLSGEEDAQPPLEAMDTQPNRHSDPIKDAALKNRIEAALAAARNLPRSKNNPMSVHAMAKALTKSHGKKLGFGFEAFKKILAGTYGPMDGLGIRRL